MCFYRVALLLCACASAHRIRSSEALQLADSTPSEEDVRAAAVESFKPPTVWMPTLDVTKLFISRIELERQSNTSMFEQTRSLLEEENPRAWGRNWSSLFSFGLTFKNESGVDASGLRKEWLSLVLQSIVIPDGQREAAGLECIKSGSCGRDAGTPQYLLEALPTGELIPVSVEESESEWAVGGKVGSMLKFAYGAYKSAYRKVLGAKASMPSAALMRFKFLGKWLARAHVVSSLGYAPMGLHGLIYKSLLPGHAVVPESKPFYSTEDTIPACEKMAAILPRRSPQELQSYGWLSCDEVKDPETGKYTQPSCYKPIYKDEAMWDALYLAWGSLAPDGAKADDPVPFAKAREFTELRCEESWKRFAEPVNSIAEGFHEVIPSDSKFYKLLNGDDKTLKHLIEGNSEVDLDEMWETILWSGWWKDEQKEVLRQALEEMKEEGRDLSPVKRPLNKLLRFFTGSFKQPVQGWKNSKVEFAMQETDRCIPLVGKTCFNELRIPSGCLESPQKLKEMIAESVVSEDFGIE